MFTGLEGTYYPIGLMPKKGLSGFGGFGSVAQDPALITALYVNILGRQPDSGGYAFWNNAYMESGDKYWLLGAFIAAAEKNGEKVISRVLPEYGITIPVSDDEVAWVEANSEIIKYNSTTGEVVSTAGFDLGSSWPILAIVGIGALMIFKKEPKSKSKGRSRRGRK